MIESFMQYLIVMKDETIRNTTGRSLEEWSFAIDEAGFGTAPHNEIARFLESEGGLSSWWSQEVTVLYETVTGHRVEGQTADGTFQIGVNRTLSADAERLWHVLCSSGFRALLGAGDPTSLLPEELDWIDGSNGSELAVLDGSSADDIVLKTTTFKPGSHLRLQWTGPDRITPKGSDRTTLTFHHEKLPDATTREEMRDRWKIVADAVDRALGAK